MQLHLIRLQVLIIVTNEINRCSGHRRIRMTLPLPKNRKKRECCKTSATYMGTVHFSKINIVTNAFQKTIVNSASSLNPLSNFQKFCFVLIVRLRIYFCCFFFLPFERNRLWHCARSALRSQKFWNLEMNKCYFNEILLIHMFIYNIIIHIILSHVQFLMYHNFKCIPYHCVYLCTCINMCSLITFSKLIKKKKHS